MTVTWGDDFHGYYCFSSSLSFETTTTTTLVPPVRPWRRPPKDGRTNFALKPLGRRPSFYTAKGRHSTPPRPLLWDVGKKRKGNKKSGTVDSGSGLVGQLGTAYVSGVPT